MSVDVIAMLRAQATDAARIWMRRDAAGDVTYADLLANTGRFANALAELGVRRGDRVLLQVQKTAAALTIYLACLRMGAVFLPVNPGYTLQETRYFLDDAEPALIIVDAERRDILADEGRPVTALAQLAERAAQVVAEFAGPTHAPDDIAAILYTSGTTGRSKGVMLSRKNLSSNAEALVQMWHFQPQDVLLHALPVFHTHGLFVATNCVLYSGASMIFQDAFVPQDVLRALPRATVMMGVPTFYTRLLAESGLTRQLAAPLRLFISGSAPLSAVTFAAWEARTGHRILERYGMTETSMITTNPFDGTRRPGTVGRPLPGVSVRIAHATTGHAVTQGETGSIEVKGPNVFHGYWRMPEQTAKEFRADGYFITGDMGAFDADGYLSILGRSKDLVITGGLNVYPAEVEAALDKLDGVAASAVIGLPHPDFGEAVVGCILASVGAAPDPEALRLALRNDLAAFKIPKRIIVLLELPRNAMGKVQKAELRRIYAGMFDA
ncbi:AMP-binding protein [Tabrizicola sp.]|uniref:AMP-binding protein n=1 Tax=Tabrizicola sp. TaxID=2005166 RepID=UPI00286A2629|nr:AMP-binding protein [Tabrizicola sp.]